jgi:L-amino acid N-acyltransferase YncA
MVEEWNIRPATEDDWLGIWQIFKDVISHGDTYTYAPDMTQDQAKDIWIRNGCHAYVVTHGDNVVGTFTIRTNKPGFGNHIANAGYMVHKNYRSRGVAQTMCQVSLKEAKKLGYQAMQFNFVVASNIPAVNLWQKMGFKIVGTVPKAFRHATKGLTDVHIMHRFLDDIVV